MCDDDDYDDLRAWHGGGDTHDANDDKPTIEYLVCVPPYLEGLHAVWVVRMKRWCRFTSTMESESDALHWSTSSTIPVDEGRKLARVRVVSRFLLTTVYLRIPTYNTGWRKRCVPNV